MPKSHTELICWQLADELRQLIIEHAADGTAAARDYRFTNNLRDAIASACRNQSEGFYKYKHKPQRPFFVTARASLGRRRTASKTDGSVDTSPPNWRSAWKSCADAQ